MLIPGPMTRNGRKDGNDGVDGHFVPSEEKPSIIKSQND